MSVFTAVYVDQMKKKEYDVPNNSTSSAIFWWQYPNQDITRVENKLYNL